VLRKNDRLGLNHAEFQPNIEGRKTTKDSFIMRTWLSWLKIVGDLIHFLGLGLRSRRSLAAENLSCANRSRSIKSATLSPADRQPNPPDAGLAQSLVRLAKRFDR
jgi:hypothetical protein